MLKSLIRTNLRQVLADDGSSVMSDTELNQIIDLAVIEYSRMRPNVINVDINTTAGTFDYIMDRDFLAIYNITSANVSRDWIQSGRTVRFALEPGSASYRISAAVIHEETGGDYTTIPDYDLQTIVDLATATVLERIADDVLRRPDITAGQTRESWGANAQLMYQRAKELRFRAMGNMSDEFFFIG